MIASERAVDSSAVRERRRRHWRYLQTQLLESHTVTAAYPWLESWVEPMRAGLAGAVDHTRRSLASLLNQAELVEAACAAALPSPKFSGAPAFVGLGTSSPWLLQEAWARWQQECAAGWSGLEAGRSTATSVLYAAFGRRRRGRAEALEGLDRLVDNWNAQARALAAQSAAFPLRPVTVDVLAIVRDSVTGREEDQLTRWEAGVIAVYQVTAHWPTGSVGLLAPSPVAAQLLRGGSLVLEAEDSDCTGL
ncbi:hypothetical protein [Kitasatospora sp. NPDC002965]|uniref:hypothetical protein n=1 Tax=Kitasatospora sp. NPDC002965 TaxID=3154775 RepID=UPI0033A0B150